MPSPLSDERGKLPVLWLMNNVVNRASSRSGPTTDKCAFLSAITCTRPDRGAGSCSYCPAGEGAASRGCQTEYQKTQYRRYYPRFHLLPPLDVITAPSLTTGGNARLTQFDEGSFISFDFWRLNWLALVVSPRRIAPRRRSSLWWLRLWLHARQARASFPPACYTF